MTAATDVTVGRVSARLRLRPADRDAGAEGRLRRALDDGCGEPLAAPLAAAGIGVDEIVLVDRVEAAVRVDLRHGDGALGAAVGAAVGEAIRAAVLAGGPGVVRYRHGPDGLADLCASVAAGDRSRRWAWRRLGWWPDPEPERPGAAVAAALAGQPSAAVAALVLLARRGRLPLVLAELDPGDLAAVAAAAAVAAGGRAALPIAAGPAGRERRGWPAPVARPGTATALAAAATRSALAGPLRSWLAGRPGAGGPVAAAAAAATLVAAEVEPALLAGDPAGDLAAALAAAVPEPASAAGPPAVPEPGAAAPPPAAGEPGAAEGDDGGRRAAPGRPSAWGGLPFLLHVAADLDVAGRVAADDRVAALGLRAVLRRAGSALTGAALDDPAVLALAGLDAGSARDRAATAPPTPEERAAVGDLAADLLAGAWDRLGDRAPDLATPGERVAWLCRRRSVVVADPGWVEVRLRDDEVAVEVRVAGLDLDPGWVPWLGCVVRFRYEGEVHRA